MQKRTIETSGSMPPSRMAVRSEDQDITLLSLWLVVRRRWPWLVAGLLFGVVLGATYAAVVKPIYESRATVQIGKVLDFGQIEETDMVAAQLLDQYGFESRGAAPYLKQASKAAGQNNMLRLVAVGYSPEQARDLLVGIVGQLMERHAQLFNETVAPGRQRLAAIQARLGMVTTQIAELNGIITRLKESQPVQASLAVIERGRLHEERNLLERDWLVLQQRTGKPQTVSSEVVAPPNLAGTPTAPRKSVSLAIGMVTGLLLGLLAVFLHEFLVRLRTGADESPQGL